MLIQEGDICFPWHILFLFPLTLISQGKHWHKNSHSKKKKFSHTQAKEKSYTYIYLLFETFILTAWDACLETWMFGNHIYCEAGNRDIIFSYRVKQNENEIYKLSCSLHNPKLTQFPSTVNKFNQHPITNWLSEKTSEI